jgi:hypothetical protein
MSLIVIDGKTNEEMSVTERANPGKGTESMNWYRFNLILFKICIILFII